MDKRFYNRYEILYISSSSESESEKDLNSFSGNKRYLCGKIKKKICRKSYRDKVDNTYNINNNNKFLELENNINKLLLNNKTNDKNQNLKNIPPHISFDIFDL